MRSEIIHLAEPPLEFGFEQQLEYTRDGLFLYGPVTAKSDLPIIRYGVIGTKRGVERFNAWAVSVAGFIAPPQRSERARSTAYHVPFPGFESAFGAAWPVRPAYTIDDISERDIESRIFIENRHEAIRATVDLYLERLIAANTKLENPPALWFVVIPQTVFQLGRPQSMVPRSLRVKGSITVTAKQARRLEREPTLFGTEDAQADVYRYAIDFRRQLKARLLAEKIVTQIVREPVVAPNDFLRADGRPLYPQEPAALAWRLCTGIYYKAGGKPWQLGNVRKGVCYVGLVYKRTSLTTDDRFACCAAQMFLTNGDGIVFRGAIGPWYQEERKQFHLSEAAARQLIEMVVREYTTQYGAPPDELFLHARSAFDDAEWKGFKYGTPSSTKVVGVQIAQSGRFKLFRPGQYPVIRGTALKLDDHEAYLWSTGYVPRLDTYMGSETPNPLWVRVVRGVCDIDTVLQDILGLTKLNFNSCVFNDRLPVTIKFADAIGDIVVAAPTSGEPRLPFKYYI